MTTKLVWKIITILTTLKTYLKMLEYTKYAPLFAQVFALSKFNSFSNLCVPLKERNGIFYKNVIGIILIKFNIAKNRNIGETKKWTKRENILQD